MSGNIQFAVVRLKVLTSLLWEIWLLMKGHTESRTICCEWWSGKDAEGNRHVLLKLLSSITVKDLYWT